MRNQASGLPVDLTRKLVEARHAHRWTQRELAGQVGLPQVHISKIETGKVIPRYDTLLEIVRVLDHDLILVPRNLVPAVQTLIRDAGTFGSSRVDEGERPLYAEDGEDRDES